MVFMGVSLVGILFYPIVFFFLFLFTMGFSFILGVIGVYINDLDHIWSVITRGLWFLTPIFYVLQEDTFVGWFNQFNPLYYFIDTARKLVIYGELPSLLAVAVIVVLPIVVLALGFTFFKRFDSRLAELV